jgi:hypothetical protein
VGARSVATSTWTVAPARSSLVRRPAEAFSCPTSARSGAESGVCSHTSRRMSRPGTRRSCRCFLAQARRERCRCRALAQEDLSAIPFAGGFEADAAEGSPSDAPQLDELGRSFRLERFETSMSIPELRWACRLSASAQEQHWLPVSLRATIASLERYEPVRTLTGRALASHEHADDVSVTVLRAELRRVRESPIVLNRGLRKAVLDAVERRGQSMSEIAMRCGRVKRDAAGNESGETSWLARRLGLLPEGGRVRTTPWIHSDVLALIARDGLGVSPREVEVD